MRLAGGAAEIADAILRLASDAASVATGAIQAVDGGVTAKAGDTKLVEKIKRI
jgi:hypothetical protein